MSHSVLPITAFFSLFWNTHGQNTTIIAPQGCSYENRKARCDFQNWNPPLQDKDFLLEPVYHLTLENINGTIPAGAFSGLNGPLENRKTYISLKCNKGKTRLTRNIFTQNLHWVMELEVWNCYIENDLPSRLLETLSSLSTLNIRIGGIEGLVVHDTLEGLANLNSIVLQAPIKSGTLPPGFFRGLLNLTSITLRNTELNSVPSNLFNGLVKLTSISLRFNKLHTLPQGLFDGLRSLTNVFLKDNPWNCSCELMWLLDWTHIADLGLCKDPPVVKNIAFEAAISLLECTPSTPTLLSVPASPLAEPTVSCTSTSTKIEKISSTTASTQITAVSVTSTTIPMILTTDSFPEPTNKVSTAVIISTTMSIPTASTALRAVEMDIINTHSSLTTVAFSRSIFMQTVYSSAPTGSISINSKDKNEAVLEDFRNIVLISGSGALTLLITAAFLIRYVYRNKRIGSVNRVDNNEEHRHGLDRQSIDRSSSS